jgi:hypothetical protein
MPVEFPENLKDDSQNVTCDKKNVSGEIWECHLRHFESLMLSGICNAAHNTGQFAIVSPV